MKNFFGEQQAAKRTTLLLVVLFIAAFSLIVFITQAFFGLLFDVRILEQLPLILYQGWDEFRVQNPYQWHWPSSIISCLIMLGAIAYKYAQLRQGGHVIAQQLGATLVQPNSYHPLERQLINVVEEMAIAAHTSVPRIYIQLNQGRVNAFAAGHDQKSAVIAVTRGALEKLTRDELQAVVAHELSHIVNQDIKLNNKLAAATFAISFIGLIGESLIHKAAQSKSKDGLSIIIGIAFVIYGFFGTLLADFIKAAICRRREFLADANAVQFNRNSQALAEALKVVAGVKPQVQLKNYHQYSHLFFTNVRSPWLSWFSTHPDIHQRIRKLQPHWQGQSTQSQRPNHSNYMTMQLAAQRHQTAEASSQPSIRQIQSIQGIDDELTQLVHEPSLLCNIFSILLLSENNETQQTQLQIIVNYPYIDIHHLDRVELLQASLSLVDKFKLLEVACNTLHCLAPARQRALQTLLTDLFNLTCNSTPLNRVQLTAQIAQWLIYESIYHQTRTRTRLLNTPVFNKKALIHAWHLLISITAHLGHNSNKEAEAAFIKTCNAFNMPNLALLDINEIDLQTAHTKLQIIAKLAPKNKAAFLDAAKFCVAVDHVLTDEEKTIIYLLGLRLELNFGKL